MIQKTHHIGINVVDINKCIPFYRDILGLDKTDDFEMQGDFLDTVQGKGGMDYRIVRFMSPEGFQVELLQDRAHPTTPQGRTTLQDAGIRHFAYQVDNVDMAYERVKEYGYETISKPETSDDGSMRLFFVRDPELNLVELMQLL